MRKPWHNLTTEEVIKELDTNNQTGLSKIEVAKRQEEYGLNVLPKEKDPTMFEIFFRQFKSPMVIILLIAVIVSCFLREFLDAFFIGLVLVLNATLGTYQEHKAVKSAASISKLLEIKAKVLRDNEKIEISSEQLVPGDIIILESGDKVPADLRLIEANNLQIDEAFLTGESVGVLKQINTVDEKASINDRSNICYASSTVQSGRGIGIVVATAIQTEIGQIAEKLVQTEESKSPLTIRLERFTKQIMYIVLIFAILATLIMSVRNHIPSEIFFLVVAMSVSAIPASLPIVQTVVLSIATSKMVKQNVVVKKLSSVESLGSCTVIASDKTGTLTVNAQTAKVITLPDRSSFTVSGEGYNDEGKIDLSKATEEQKHLLKDLAIMGMINNEAHLEKKDGEFTYHGDSINLAFLSLGKKQGLKVDTLNEKPFGYIHYESENQFSAAFYKKDDENFVTVKGSSEVVLSFCKKQRVGNKDVSLDEEKLKKEFLALSAKGYRVIALATGKYKGKEKDNYEKKDIKDLTFIGFVGFIDPIRNTSKDAIEKCHSAGIRVLMITGDHPLTASSIAKELNLSTNERAITGEEVEVAYHKGKKELLDLVMNYNVFARVSPMQKSIIVETLKDNGEFVAVTGDGINDAPALKKSNIGVAMGSGTDVAKDVSTMIITDDNFKSIVTAVEEGRHAYSNLRKVVYLLISASFAEMLLYMLSIIVGLPPVFTTVQILWINLVTNGIQDIAIAFEKGEPGAMKEKPRSTSESIFDKLLVKETMLSGFVMFVIVFIVWHHLNTRTNMGLNEARNFILLLMVLLQNVHAFNCRSEKTSAFKMPLKNNPFIVYAVLGALGLHLLFMNVPILQGVLRTNPVSIGQFGFVVLMALPLLFTMEIFKWINNKKQNS